MLRSVIPTTIEIRQKLADSGLVMSNPPQLHQIIMNLCPNAVHAMADSGVLEIGLKRTSVDHDGSAALDLSPGSYMLLSVSDTGAGMSPDIVDKIFDPYFTTKEKGRGTGLGLSVVHGIVKSHHGAVVCRSEPGTGSTFEVYLPELESAEEPAGLRLKKTLPRGSERILVVDDEPALTDLMHKILGNLGYQVTTRTSSSDALELFSGSPQSFDLVITDMTMPVMRGDRLSQKILEARPDLPIILCTGYSEHVSAEDSRGLGSAPTS
jgi:CheY-like chemotaxis protein/anti-sigma regulatory factor (Ser/Thr protein kinase)